MLGWPLNMPLRALPLILFVAMLGCAYRQTAEEPLTLVWLPDGTEIRVEVMTRPEDMARGMMFRDSLAADRGMLFVHDRPGRYRYWMYQCLIPLDILWLDSSKRIVEISADTPPCKTEAEACPTYGGNYDAQYVLELAAGSAARHGLKPGDAIRF